MRVAVLGSGSGGNSLIVESAGVRLLIDAGFSCRQIEKRLRSLDQEAGAVDALLLTHEHSDHSRGAPRLVRRHGMPVYATAGTLAEARMPEDVLERSTAICSGSPFEIADKKGSPAFRVEAFGVPHDAREPVGFLVEDAAGHRLGLVADLGMRTQLAWGRLSELDILILETNHDLHMLRSGPYPWFLKQRVAGRHGHLSNQDAAAGLPELLSERLRWVVLYHLSKTNNLAALAAQTIGEQLDRERSSADVAVSEQDQPSPWLEIVHNEERP